jgi:hypothetical protein
MTALSLNASDFVVPFYGAIGGEVQKEGVGDILALEGAGNAG